ncbi:hypothetical protein INS49_007282 [Diaporthe citri]|uniref:uncharacterized protein n=1 Tax=Diaporthe citri TaxID=83186 RepID=UPI001C813BA6|nr:uncharacterized protein INS49_007282 [Diaporthe citri]KAG6365671.1 hypothetical protein INS49_007282 [Diaporthe citri]
MSETAHATSFCHLFLDGEDQYLFVKNLGSGAYSQAQLVLHLQTGELRVRKVSRRHLDEEEKKKEDREKVLFYLQEQAAKLGVQPPIAHLFSAHDVPAAQGMGKGKWSRVAYMKYYNGGDVCQLHEAYEESGQGMPSSLILRLLKQVVCALYFTGTCGVLHADLHDGNILIHHNAALGGRPDFYIADFGAAERGALTDCMNRYTDDVDHLSQDLDKWLYAGPKVDDRDRDVLWRYLDAVVYTVLLNLASQPMDHLPDLKPLIDVLQYAPAGPPETLPVGYDPEPEDACVPLYHISEQGALCAHGVAGPWHLAQVSIDRSTGHVSVVNISPETHDNAANPRLIWADSGSTLGDSDREAALERIA